MYVLYIQIIIYIHMCLYIEHTLYQLYLFCLMHSNICLRLELKGCYALSIK